jgi:HB1/ASXL restriction endonuclease-like protein with HTH domain
MEAGEPLHYKEIASRILKQHLVRIRGRRPDRSVNARLSAEILKNGNASPFVRVAAGLFGLRERGDSRVAQAFAELITHLNTAEQESIAKGPKEFKLELLDGLSRRCGDIVEMKILTRQVAKLRDRWLEISAAEKSRVPIG